jgi:hypothetical protein
MHGAHRLISVMNAALLTEAFSILLTPRYFAGDAEGLCVCSKS